MMLFDKLGCRLTCRERFEEIHTKGEDTDSEVKAQQRRDKSALIIPQHTADVVNLYAEPSRRRLGCGNPQTGDEEYKQVPVVS